jgi:DedD protein
VAATGGAWAIQVGSFSSRDNAERLVKQLESKGFKAYVSKTGTGAKQMYRVRVGPVPSRAAVDALAQKLRAAGRAGTVVAPGA